MICFQLLAKFMQKGGLGERYKKTFAQRSVRLRRWQLAMHEVTYNRTTSGNASTVLATTTLFYVSIATHVTK